jgi:hypothetical protein
VKADELHGYERTFQARKWSPLGFGYDYYPSIEGGGYADDGTPAFLVVLSWRISARRYVFMNCLLWRLRYAFSELVAYATVKGRTGAKNDR